MMKHNIGAMVVAQSMIGHQLEAMGYAPAQPAAPAQAQANAAAAPAPAPAKLRNCGSPCGKQQSHHQDHREGGHYGHHHPGLDQCGHHRRRCGNHNHCGRNRRRHNQCCRHDENHCVSRCRRQDHGRWNRRRNHLHVRNHRFWSAGRHNGSDNCPDRIDSDELNPKRVDSDYHLRAKHHQPGGSKRTKRDPDKPDSDVYRPGFDNPSRFQRRPGLCCGSRPGGPAGRCALEPTARPNHSGHCSKRRAKRCPVGPSGGSGRQRQRLCQPADWTGRIADNRNHRLAGCPISRSDRAQATGQPSRASRRRFGLDRYVCLAGPCLNRLQKLIFYRLLNTFALQGVPSFGLCPAPAVLGCTCRD